MKILYVAAFAEPGNERWFSLGRQRKVNQVISILSTLNFEVTRLNIAPSNKSASFQDLVNLCQSNFIPIRFAQLLLSSISSFLFSAHLRSASIIWLYNTRAAESIVALVGLLLRPRLKLVLQLEDLPSARQANHGFAGFMDNISTYLLGKRANHVFAVSKNVSAAFMRRFSSFRHKICILPPALDPIFVSKVELRGEPFSSTPLTILYAGSFQPDKGVTDLIDAFLRLPRDSYKLILVGSAPLSLRLKYKHVQGICFTGVIKTEALFDYYTSADVVVNPHRAILNPDYVFPFKLVETVASGALPLTTPVPGHQIFNLPHECLFQSVDELAVKLIKSQEIWVKWRKEILKSAVALRSDYSFESISIRISKTIDIVSATKS